MGSRRQIKLSPPHAHPLPIPSPAVRPAAPGGEVLRGNGFAIAIQSLNCIVDMEDNNDDLDEQNESKNYQINVPQDAQGFILSFLPGRVVMKLRRVCKFWRDIVDVPSFVDRHLSNSFLFHQSIACFTLLDRGPAHMYTFDPTSRNFKGSRLVLSNRFHMSGPCNGLVCAYDSDGNAEILNPTTQRHLYLPVSELKSQSLYSEYFLGFVLSTKEYKMVSIRHRIKFLTFEICTFGTQRTPSWRIVHESAELLKTTKAVIVNDAMYWLLLHEGSFVICEEILMLNLTDEKFSQISLPDSAKGHDLALLEGEGKLHLLSMPVEGSNNAVSEIWVMDYTNQIWVQLEAVVPPVLDGISLFFLCKMKIFCGSQNILFLINLLDGTVSYIRMPSGQSLISCGMFVESFAPAGIGLLNSTASSSNGAGSSSSVVRRSSDVIGWSTADLKRFLARARRRMNMKWKISKRGLDIR